jgi:hypothetical protein
MKGLKNWKSHNKENNYISFNITKSRYTFVELFNGFEEFKEFMNRFNVSAEWVEDQFKKNPRINMNNLFDYTSYTTNFLEEEDGVYTEKWERINGNYVMRRENHSVYVTSYVYASLTLNVLAELAMKLHFPKMFENPFTKMVKLSPSMLNLTMDTTINDFHMDTIGTNYTFGDVFRIINDVMNGKTENEQTIFTIYSNGHVFCTVNDSYSAHFDVEDFFSKNWEDVKNKRVFSVPKENPPKNFPLDKWYDGLQGDYFAFKKSSIVKHIKETFFD